MSQHQIETASHKENETSNERIVEQIGESSKSSAPNEMISSLDIISPKTVDVHEGEHPLSSRKEETLLPLASSSQHAIEQNKGPDQIENLENTEQPPPTSSQTNAIQTVQIPEATNLFGGENEALSVRRNLLRNVWGGFTTLTKFRRWILILRLLIGLAQVVAGITVLALPSSLGDSTSYPETCDPEGMFVYLVLHCARVLCSMPIDLYLGMSPHRSPRSRRPGAEGLADRERQRRVGSLRLDRKAGRFSDLLGLCHIVLFIVGNYVVWTSFECSHSPADSRPLFFTCIGMLCITYVIIMEIALMIFLVVFFLPLLIACFRVLGITHRLPQRAIHPETGKISQDDIEKHTKLVFFKPAERVEEVNEKEDGNQVTVANVSDDNKEPSTATLNPSSNDVSEQHPLGQRKRWRIGHLIGLSRRQNSSTNLRMQQRKGKSSVQSNPVSENGSNTEQQTSRYPFYAIPAHRATCPICLCDYEEISSSSNRTTTQTNDYGGQEDGEGRDTSKTATLPNEEGTTNGTTSQQVLDDLPLPITEENNQEPELLRLLRCGHVMHKQCVDQWLSTVSGRCPVCQKAILPSSEDEIQGNNAERAAANQQTNTASNGN